MIVVLHSIGQLGICIAVGLRLVICSDLDLNRLDGQNTLRCLGFVILGQRKSIELVFTSVHRQLAIEDHSTGQGNLILQQRQSLIQLFLNGIIGGFLQLINCFLNRSRQLIYNCLHFLRHLKGLNSINNFVECLLYLRNTELAIQRTAQGLFQQSLDHAAGDRQIVFQDKVDDVLILVNNNRQIIRSSGVAGHIHELLFAVIGDGGVLHIQSHVGLGNDHGANSCTAANNLTVFIIIGIGCNDGVNACIGGSVVSQPAVTGTVAADV